MVRFVAVVFLFVALPVVAAAEGATSHCDDQQECTEYFMDGESLTGTLVRPDEGLYTSSRRINRPTLIKARNHFINELRKSVEDI